MGSTCECEEEKMVAVWACWAPSSVAGPQEERKGAGPWKQREEKGNAGVGWASMEFGPRWFWRFWVLIGRKNRYPQFKIGKRKQI